MAARHVPAVARALDQDFADLRFERQRDDLRIRPAIRRVTEGTTVKSSVSPSGSICTRWMISSGSLLTIVSGVPPSADTRITPSGDAEQNLIARPRSSRMAGRRRGRRGTTPPPLRAMRFTSPSSSMEDELLSVRGECGTADVPEVFRTRHGGRHHARQRAQVQPAVGGVHEVAPVGRDVEYFSGDVRSTPARRARRWRSA